MVRVHGLNLSVPEDARSIIKPWDQREDDDRYAESGVDDQVWISPAKITHNLNESLGGLPHTLHTKSQNQIYLAQNRYIHHACHSKDVPRTHDIKGEGKPALLIYGYTSTTHQSSTLPTQQISNPKWTSRS